MTTTSGSKKCNCNMFRTRGICWHTGYRPEQGMAELPLVEPVPEYELRRRAFLALLKEANPNAADVQDNPER